MTTINLIGVPRNPNLGRSRASLRFAALAHPIRRNLEKLAHAFQIKVSDLLTTDAIYNRFND